MYKHHGSKLKPVITRVIRYGWHSLGAICLCAAAMLAQAQNDTSVWRALHGQYTKTQDEAQSASNAQDAKRAQLRALSQGTKMDAYLEQHPASVSQREQVIETYLSLSDTALRNREYDVALNYVEKSLAHITRADGPESKRMIDPRFIRIAAEKRKMRAGDGPASFTDFFSELIALSEKVNGPETQAHFRLLERCALFIFEQNPRPGKPWVDRINTYDYQAFRHYHFYYGFFHRQQMYSEAGKVLESLFVKRLNNPGRYQFERHIPALYFLAQYKHTRGGFNVATTLFERVIDHPSAADFRYRQHKRLALSYLFQYYQHRQASHLADDYWRRLYPLASPYQGHVVFHRDLSFPDVLYAEKKSDEVIAVLSIDEHGYVARIVDIKSQHNSQAAITNAKAWLKTIRFTPYYDDGVPSMREETLHIPFEYNRYLANIHFRDSGTTEGYVKQMATHFFPGL